MSHTKLWFSKRGMGLSNLLANIVGVAFAQVVSSRVERQLPDDVLSNTLLSTTSVLFAPVAIVLLMVVTRRYEQPIKACLSSVAQGLEVPEALALKARRRLLNEPFVTMLLDFAIWTMAALLFSLIFWHMGIGPIAIQRVIFNTLSVGAITVITAFFLQEHVLRRHLAPVLFPKGGMAAVPGTHRIRISTRLAALLLASNLLPLASVLLLVFRIVEAHSEPQITIDILRTSILTYTIVFIAVGVLLTLLISRNLTHPFREIIDVLRGVREGRFDRKVSVTTNDEIGYTGDAINEMTAGLQERERMRQAMTLAMEVQQNLLPRHKPHIEGFDIAGASLYCEETGGDYFDYFEWPEAESAFGTVVADVSGHGLPSALLMASIRACLRQRMVRPDDLGRVAEDVNHQLSQDVEDTGRFATMFLAAFDRPGRRLRWVNAGHDPALVYETLNDRFHELGRTGLPLGVSESGTHREAVHDLSSGQIVIIGTDGIWEACDPRGQMFGKPRLREVIRRLSAESATTILEAVMREVTSFSGSLPRMDDLTLVVIKIV